MCYSRYEFQLCVFNMSPTCLFLMDAFISIYYFYSFEAGFAAHCSMSPDHLTNVTTTFVFTQGPQHWWIMRHIFRIVFVLAFLVCLHITMHPQPSCFQNSCFSDKESMRLLSCDSLADLHFGCDSIIMSPVFGWRMSYHREATTSSLQKGISALGKHVRQHAGRESNFPA